jgi:glycosyltransferase involved in cell wall biosynthesis
VVLVFDDGSFDATGAEAGAAGALVIRLQYKKGNGAAVMTGIRAATGEYILIVDGDGQHQPSDAVRLTSRLGEYDLVVGARSSETQAGLVRRLGNGALNRLASFLTERPVPDLTSGFRAARRACLLEFIGLLPNGFSTPTTTTMCFIKAGYNVAFEPVEARARTGTSKIRLSRDGPKFLLIMLRVMTIFSPLRIFLPIAATSFLVGAGYGVWTVVTQRHITNSSVLLVMSSIVILLVGLVSEQVSAQRFDGRR